MKGNVTASEVSYEELMVKVKELQALIKSSSPSKRKYVRRPKVNVQNEQKPIEETSIQNEQPTAKLELQSDNESLESSKALQEDVQSDTKIENQPEAKVINLIEAKIEYFTPSEEVAKINAEVKKEVDLIHSVNQRVMSSLANSSSSDNEERTVPVQMKIEVSSQERNKMSSIQASTNNEGVGATWGGWAEDAHLEEE